MKSVALKAYPRSQVQRAEVKKLRAAGRVPATIYGRHAKTQNLAVGFEEITDLLHRSASENVLVDLSVENDAARHLALVQDVQHHPLNGSILHVDLHEVADDEKVTVLVPLETEGEPIGLKAGGTLDHVMFKLKVRCLPKDLPEQIVIDVSALEIGKSVQLGQVAAPAGVEILGDKNRAVVTVAAPRAEEEVAPAATAAAPGAGDVEMTKEKKEEGAEGAAPAAKGDAKAGKGDAKAAAGDKKGEAKAEGDAKADAKAKKKK